MGICTVNEAELLALIREAVHLNLWHLMVEGDSLCAIQWSLGLIRASWVDVVEEVLDLARKINASSHIKQSANVAAKILAKQGIR